MPETENRSTAKETTFKGRPLVELYQAGHNTPLIRFGAAKARLILENLDAIRGFCAKNQGQAAPAAQGSPRGVRRGGYARPAAAKAA